MEGLIPMMFRAIQKNRTRRQYECLSSGASETYNIADFYANGQNPPVYMNTYAAEEAEDKYTASCRHRRHNSVGGDMYKNDHFVGSSSPVPRKLVRFRSQRMFSCVTGA